VEAIAHSSSGRHSHVNTIALIAIIMDRTDAFSVVGTYHHHRCHYLFIADVAIAVAVAVAPSVRDVLIVSLLTDYSSVVDRFRFSPPVLLPLFLFILLIQNIDKKIQIRYQKLFNCFFFCGHVCFDSFVWWLAGW
jgi:hypothetical protein